jgi:hypothetical protein
MNAGDKILTIPVRSVMNRPVSCLILGTVLLTGVSLFAHHGTSVTYQTDKTIILSGVVTEFAFAYPHPQLYFDVKDDKGNVQHWGSELAPTPLMMKNMHVGWSKESIKPGDQVTITCNPHKLSTANVCLCKELIINGKKLPLGPANQQTEGK